MHRSRHQKTFRHLCLVFSGWILVAGVSTEADASILVTWENVGSDLKASWTGTFDISAYTGGGAAVTGPGKAKSQGDPAVADFFFESGSNTPNNAVNHFKASTSFGGDLFFFDTGDTTNYSGIVFEVITVTGGNSTFNIDNSWSPGNTITGNATWANKSLSSVFSGNLPLFQNKVMFDDGTNTVTFQAVPEPTALMLAFGGVAAGLWQCGRRHRRRTSGH